MLKKYFPVIFVLIFNLWIWGIFSSNEFVGILVSLTTLLLFTVLNTKNKRIVFPALLATCYLLLIFLQYKTSSINSLTFLNEQEQTLQIQRMHGYPPKFARWANWLEARPEILVFYKLQENLSEAVNPNLYFFANHPRERAGIVEYEKFPYILLPFLIMGVFTTKKDKLKYLFLSLSPIFLISIIGNSNSNGPFSLFPFLAAFTAVGINNLILYKTPKKKTIHYIILSTVFILVFIQTYAYATH